MPLQLIDGLKPLARAAGLQQLDAAAAELFVVSKLPGEMIEGLDAAARRKLQRELDEQKRIVRQFTDHTRFVSINKVQLLDVPGDPAKDEVWR